MANTLFDQLKKSGLVDDKKAKKAKQSQYKNKKQKTKKGAPTELDEQKLQAQKAHAEKVERDRQLNLQRKEEAERKAVVAQIKQLIETSRVKDRDGDIVYNFTDQNVVKRLYVSEKVHGSISSGRLAIVKLDEAYELVPTAVAEKIKQRDEKYIVMTVSRDVAELDENDPYSDFQIPDDLMW